MSSNCIKTDRILSLDVVRGLTIALMVVVNAQSTTSSYPILEHSAWNGCTLADLVFPFFLYIVGISTVISLQKHLLGANKVSWSLYHSIINRSILLFLLGLLLTAFPHHFDVASLRIYGVLQRIACCYLICALIFINSTTLIQVLIFIALLLGYWILMTLIPFPGAGLDQLSSTNNWVVYVDKKLFSAPHLLGKCDPEGLLSTLPALATTLSGVLTGRFLLTAYSKEKKCGFMVLMGLLFLLVGHLWSYNFPMNKNLWTSSYVLWTSGLALITLALCFFIIDILEYKKWTLPFKVLGMNALFVFSFHVLLLKIQPLFTLHLGNEIPDNIRALITEYLLGAYNPENAGLFYALSVLFLNFLVAVVLYKRKIFLRI